MEIKLIASGYRFPDSFWEFWKIGNEVYRSRPSELDVFGCPMSKRWECSYAHWLVYRDLFSWAKDC